MEPSSADLRYFLEVTREGNISQAARKLGISQPSLSLAIQRIEKSLGEKVLLRDRSGAKPTRAGETLLKNTHKLLDAWEEVRAILKDRESALKGTVILGCHPEVAMDSLPLFLPKLLMQAPELNIQLLHDFSRTITQQVIEGKVDVGIVINPRSFPDLVIKSLSYDEMSLWVGRKTNIQNIFPSLIYADIPQSHKIIRGLSKSGMKFQRHFKTNDMQVICSLVASGCGAGIISREVAIRNPAYELVKVKNAPVVLDRVAVIYRQENRSSKLIQSIVNAIGEGHREKYGSV